MRSRDRQQDTINPKSLAAQGHKGALQLSWAVVENPGLIICLVTKYRVKESLNGLGWKGP